MAYSHHTTMEDFLLVVLLVAVLYLLIRQRNYKSDHAELIALIEQVQRLERSLAAPERPSIPPPAAAHTPPAAQAPAPPPTPTPPPTQVMAAPRFVIPFIPAPTPPPAPVSIPQPPSPSRSLSFEERLGQNWLNKLGIVALLIGISLFLGRELRTVGPLGKSAIGLTLSLLILLTGLFLERRDNYRIFARAAIGGGWALTFFVSFAVYHLPAMQILHSQALDLILMMIVACAMVVHSLRYHSQVVTGLAFLLAFVTVGISEVTLFSLVAGAILAAGLIYVAATERWFELALAGLIGVYLNHFLWLHRVLPNGAVPGHPFPSYAASAALLLLYWLLFRLLYIFCVPSNRRQTLVSTLTAILDSAGLLALLKYQSVHPEWAFYGLLTLGVAELLLAFLARRRNRTAFIVLSNIASVFLLAAIPFRFSGSSWSILWLLQAELLFLAGIALRESVFRRLGILSGLVAALQILAGSVAPLLIYRHQNPDISVHLHLFVALVTAALLFGFNAEFVPRRWAFVAEHGFDRSTLIITSYAAAFSAAAALWVVLPSAWTLVAWLALTLLLSWASDKLASPHLPAQADLLALAAVIRAIAINLQLPSPGHLSLRAITITLAAAMLYLLMRRRSRAFGTEVDYVPPVYTWSAAGLLTLLLWYELQPAGVTVVWAVFGLVLLELGLALRKNFFYHQGCALLAASFVRIFFVNIGLENTGPHAVFGPRLYTILPLIAAYFWAYERLQEPDQNRPLDKYTSVVAACCATTALAALVYFEFRPAWVVIAWSVLALLAMLLSWLLKRSLFVFQSIALLLAASVRGLLFNLLPPTPIAVSFVTSRTFTVTAASVLMLLTLLPAYAIRRSRTAGNPTTLKDKPLWQFLLDHPEQIFFFAPFLLITVLLALQLRAGMITIAWSALGLVTFLFALTVGERSFRLAGLGLLMLCVTKILCVDIWHASPTDRYITLIVLGIALLAVSFLYSRFRETILKLL